MDIQEKKVFDAYFKEKYPELYKDVFDEDGDDRAIIGYSFAWSAWQAVKAKTTTEIDDLKAQLKAVHESRAELVEYCNGLESSTQKNIRYK